MGIELYLNLLLFVGKIQTACAYDLVEYKLALQFRIKTSFTFS